MTDRDDQDGFLPRDGWIERILYMMVFLALFAVGETLLWTITLAQMLWSLIYGRPNEHVADFGARLGVWMKRVVHYQAGVTDEKPFPWREID